MMISWLELVCFFLATGMIFGVLGFLTCALFVGKRMYEDTFHDDE